MISGKIVKSNLIEAVTVISSATSLNCWPCHRQTGTALERLGRAPPPTPPTAPAAPAAAPRTAGVGPMNGSVLLERRILSLWETPVKISYRGKSICWENLRFAVLWSILAFNNLPKSDLPSGVFVRCNQDIICQSIFMLFSVRDLLSLSFSTIFYSVETLKLKMFTCFIIRIPFSSYI